MKANVKIIHKNPADPVAPQAADGLSGSPSNPLNNENGSIIIIALMVLVTLTVIGVMSSGTTVTENFIIRNQAIHKQNVNMVESAVLEQFQQLMQLPFDDPDIVDVNSSSLAWVGNVDETWAATDWYAPDASARVLVAANSIALNTSRHLTDRGEAASGNLRVAFVGWDVVEYEEGSASLETGAAAKPEHKKGRMLGEYASRNLDGTDNGYGMLRMEIGVIRTVSPM